MASWDGLVIGYGDMVWLAVIAALAIAGGALAVRDSSEGGRSDVVSSEPTTRTIVGAPTTNGTAVFRLRGIVPRRIGYARLDDGCGRRRVAVRRVRAGARRGGLALRVRRASRGRACSRRPRLVLRMTRATAQSRGAHGLANGSTPSPACPPSYGTFSHDRRPPACWRPYAPSSPFNRPIPANPRLGPDSAAIVRRVLSWTPMGNLVAGQAGTSRDWARPVYWSNADDPVFRIHCTEAWGRCPVEGREVRIPNAARPSGGEDAHLSVVDQRTDVEWDFWHVQSKPPGGGVLTVGWGGTTSINGSGLGSAAVAANFGTAAGLIRAEELEAGRIRHALFASVQCDSGRAVYPADKTGASCPGVPGAPPMGARLQLAMTRGQINALAVPGWKKAILLAMATYGIYIGDTGGTFDVKQESGVVYTSFGHRDLWATLGQRFGVPYYAAEDVYVFNLAAGVDWARKLRVIDPCVSQGSC